MRKHTLAAVIACILGIVLLALLAFFILFSQKGIEERFPDLGNPLGSESGRQTAGNVSGQETDISSTGAGETLPTDAADRQSETAETETASESVPDAPDAPALVADAAAAQKRSQALTGTRTAQSEAPIPHSVIFAGDSRTLGLRDAQKRLECEDGDLFVGAVGEGRPWFESEGRAQLDPLIRDNPDAPVVLNFGVNDPEETDNYIVAYWDLIRSFPDTDIYILSVNPIDEEFILEGDLVDPNALGRINNLSIARMNVRLKEEFGSRYLDSASYLRQTGYETVDGLHFTGATYLKIHDFVVKKIFGWKPSGDRAG